MLGGYLADRYLGQRKAVLFGAVLLTFGHFLMAFEGDGGQDDPTINVFWLALALHHRRLGLPQGEHLGDRRPALPAHRRPPRRRLHDLLHGHQPGRRDRPILGGYLGQTYGWNYGFGAAGVGMLLGLIVFVWGKPLLMGRGESRDPARLAARVAGIQFEWLLYLIGIAAVRSIWVPDPVPGLGRRPARRRRRDRWSATSSTRR